jgi:hypothetical protein
VVTLKNAISWDVTLRGSCTKCSGLRLLVTANVVPDLPNLVTLTMEMIHSSKTSVLTTATQCNIAEDGILFI